MEDHWAKFGAQRGTFLETATAERPPPHPCPEEASPPVRKGPVSGAPTGAVPLSQSSSGLRTPRQMWGPPSALGNGAHLQWCSGQVKNLRETPSDRTSGYKSQNTLVRASQITWMPVYGCSELPTHRSPPRKQRPRSGTFSILVCRTHSIFRVKLSKAGYRGKVLHYFLFFPYPAFCFNLKN